MKNNDFYPGNAYGEGSQANAQSYSRRDQNTGRRRDGGQDTERQTHSKRDHQDPLIQNADDEASDDDGFDIFQDRERNSPAKSNTHTNKFGRKDGMDLNSGQSDAREEMSQNVRSLGKHAAKAAPPQSQAALSLPRFSQKGGAGKRLSSHNTVDVKQSVVAPSSHAFNEAGRPVQPSSDIENLEALSVGPISRMTYLSQTSKHKHGALANVIGTEILIDKILSQLNYNKDNLQDWPTDTIPNDMIRINLSYTKMLNEVNLRQPRTHDASGEIRPIPVCGSSAGCHTCCRSLRKSDLNELGPGVVLYFKMLQLFQWLFFVFFILSIPLLCTYYSGSSLVDERRGGFRNKVSETMLGNMGPSQSIDCSHQIISDDVDSPENYNLAIPFQCDSGGTITQLVHFGLAYDEESCTGFGMDITVRTVTDCTYGSFTDATIDEMIEAQFKQDCDGKQQCDLQLDTDLVFDGTCLDLLQARMQGDTLSGPPKVYALARCEYPTYTFFPNYPEIKFEMKRELANYLVVYLDLIILVSLFAGIAILRHFEGIHKKDEKESVLKIDDYTVYIPNIPIAPDTYNSQPELLKSIITTHLEDVIKSYFIDVKDLSIHDAEQLAQVTTIHFGAKNLNIIEYLVQIHEQVKEVQKLKDRLQNSHVSVNELEQALWHRYNVVTKLKEEYFAVRNEVKQTIVNAYVTFRTKDARDAAIKIYDISTVKRVCLESVCFSQIFKRIKLLSKGFLEVRAAPSPENVIWENLGSTAKQKASRYLSAFSLVLVLLIMSFYCIWGNQYVEKLRVAWVRSDCSGQDLYTKEEAYNDFRRVGFDDHRGKMHCFCRQQFDIQGDEARDILFYHQVDRENYTYCNDWYLIYFNQDYTSYVQAFLILLFNLIFRTVLESLGKCRKTKTEQDNLIYRTMTIYIAEYVNTVVVLVLVYQSYGGNPWAYNSETGYHVLDGPFDEFDMRWYVAVGTPIAIAMIVSIISPHFGILGQFLIVTCKRCKDRDCTRNRRITKQIIQSDYEDLYTGPEFLLHIRFAQILWTIMVTFTFSAGIPGLYFVAFIGFVLMYWIDKYMVLRYYKKGTHCTGYLSSMVVKQLPLAGVLHIAFSLAMFSCPDIVTTARVKDYFGSGNFASEAQYVSEDRIGQLHIVVYTWTSFAILFIFLFKDLFVLIGRDCKVKCKQWCKKEEEAKDKVDVDIEQLVDENGNIPFRTATEFQQADQADVQPVGDVPAGEVSHKEVTLDLKEEQDLYLDQSIEAEKEGGESMSQGPSQAYSQGRSQPPSHSYRSAAQVQQEVQQVLQEVQQVQQQVDQIGQAKQDVSPVEQDNQNKQVSEEGAKPSDLYIELNYLQLYKEYKASRLERQRINRLKQKNTFTQDQMSLYINKYTAILKRNELDMRSRLAAFTDTHLGRIRETKDLFSVDDKIQAVALYYDYATDSNNTYRHYFQVEPSAHGTLDSKIQSYHLMDNPKYKDCKKILEAIKQAYVKDGKQRSFVLGDPTAEALIKDLQQRIIEDYKSKGTQKTTNDMFRFLAPHQVLRQMRAGECHQVFSRYDIFDDEHEIALSTQANLGGGLMYQDAFEYGVIDDILENVDYKPKGVFRRPKIGPIAEASQEDEDEQQDYNVNALAAMGEQRVNGRGGGNRLGQREDWVTDDRQANNGIQKRGGLEQNGRSGQNYYQSQMNSMKEDTFEQLQAKQQDSFGQLGGPPAPNSNAPIGYNQNQDQQNYAIPQSDQDEGALQDDYQDNYF